MREEETLRGESSFFTISCRKADSSSHLMCMQYEKQIRAVSLILVSITVSNMSCIVGASDPTALNEQKDDRFSVGV